MQKLHFNQLNSITLYTKLEVARGCTNCSRQHEHAKRDV